VVGDGETGEAGADYEDVAVDSVGGEMGGMMGCGGMWGDKGCGGC
jgi:hypothetical protein